MRILIASENEATGSPVVQRLRGGGMDVAWVGIEVLADRASRLLPPLIVLVLPAEVDTALAALREIKRLIRHSQVLVVGPTSDAKLILRTMHEGADEYLDERQLEEELAGALVRFKARQHPSAESPGAGGRVVSVLAPSGGCGASTLAVNLGAILAQNAGQCALVDLRLAAGDLAGLLDVQPLHTLAELSDRLERIDPSMFEQFFVRHPSGISLLAAPTEYAELSKVTDKAVRRALGMARVRFPYVVVDVDNPFAAEQIEALWQSDTILMILRLDYIALRNARRAMGHLVQLGLGLERVQLVANHYGLAQQLAVRQAEEALGRKIAYYVPHDPARVNSAVNRGLPVVLQHPNAKVSRSLRDLAANVNGIHPA